MIDDVGFAPFRAMRSWLLCSFGDCCVEKQVVEFILAEPVQRLLSKRLHRLQIGELERQDGQAVLGSIEA